MKSSFRKLLTLNLIIMLAGTVSVVTAQNRKNTNTATENHPLVLKVKKFRELRKTDKQAANDLLASDARLWFEKKEGAGNPYKVEGGPWSHWDEFFKSQSTYKDWQAEGNSVSVVAIEINDFYRLIDRPASPVRLTWFFNDAEKISGFLVQAVKTEPAKDRLDDFKAWASQHNQSELDYLMPEGRINPEGDRPERWKAILIKWRQATGLPTIK